MTNYSDWNTAIVHYFTQNVPYSTKIYLSLDDDALTKIGANFAHDCTDNSWAENFCEIVSRKVVNGEKIDLDTISGHDSLGYPRGIAFLGIMVLAANQMAEDEQIDQRNYFKRLRQILNLPDDGQPRPKGLKIELNEEAPEVQLWKQWNRWLIRQGFIPTAQEGFGKTTKNTNYPISQSLLRNADKDRLRRIFIEMHWQTRWDEQTLFTKVANEYSRYAHHLRSLIDDRQRYEPLAQAIHETYLDWLECGSANNLIGESRQRAWSRQLYAGIYRTEDFLGNIEYSLYPKQQRGRSLDSLEVQCNGNSYPLREDRAGWYLPVGILFRQEISEGTTYQIKPDTQVEKLILPRRDFWVLVPDPDNPESGVYASWSSPKLGEQFIILFRESLFTDLQRLRDENLIQWEGDRENKCQVFGDNSNWYEIYQCQVLSQAWDGVFLQSQELKDALQPTTKLSISLSGGLRVASSKGWIFDYPPQVTAFAFHPSVEIEVSNIQGNSAIAQKSYPSNTPMSFNFPSVGEFMIRANCLGETSQRLIKLINWGDVDMALQNQLGG
ncbi:hypothetical protein GlitD10_2121 [Gloeomargarita lithophora Alchichica-D10]|uniref:Uncharacterized protein n=1 Tax=Gloeomargarita lithophora Alchichica-D10 TaxID=1188229 RepID=A0A1J0AET0_9CYAN|nr:hypothetical protein [Gloeomargarita lithophora]APB34450.1 hypothetical protein GlitD10_2121 [Gloeomargarita lithophora Alchichica-D10]